MSAHGRHRYTQNKVNFWELILSSASSLLHRSIKDFVELHCEKCRTQSEVRLSPSLQVLYCDSRDSGVTFLTAVSHSALDIPHRHKA